MKLALLLASVVATATGHGTLTVPESFALHYDRVQKISNRTDVQESGDCGTGACEWYTQDTVIPGAATNCDPRTRTMGVHCGSAAPVDYPCTAGAAAPWCAPGAAPVLSGCGVYAGGKLGHGRDMLDLAPGSAAAKDSGVSWKAGEPASVGWSMIANHGGGYAYRLCPAARAAQPDSEACFQATTLRFGKETQVRLVLLLPLLLLPPLLLLLVLLVLVLLLTPSLSLSLY